MGRPVGVGAPGLPGGGNGSGGGGMGEEGRSQKSAAAFMFYPSKAVYELNGGKTTARLGGPMHTDATLKAAWAKRGKELKLSLDGNQYSGPAGGDILLKEQWEFSKDGHSLIVDRALHSRRGSTTLHLVFHKEGVTPNGA
ncbi:MAG: hypothetical protein ACRD11_09700 [Terriglobia bacterium]